MNYTPRWPLFGLDASAQTAKEESDVPPDALDFHSAFRSYHQSGIGDRFRQTFGFSASDAANATVAGPTAPHWQPVAAPAPVKEAQSPTQAQAPRESAADRKRPAPNTSQTSKRPRPESGDDLVAPIVESGAEVKVIAAAAPPTEREQEQIDGDIDNLDELIEEQPEEVEAPKKKRKTTHVQIQPELPKDPLGRRFGVRTRRDFLRRSFEPVALGKAKKLIDDIIDEWDNFDAFAADDDAPADVMQDAHQRKQASNRKAEDDDRNHFVFRSTDDRGPALISAESLAKLTYAIDKVNEAGKIKELGDAIDGGVQGLLKIMQWVDNWVHLPGIRLELDKTANRLKSRPQPLGEAGDGQAADQEDALDSASLSEALKRAKTSLDASYLSLSVMVGGAGKLERRVRPSVHAREA